MKLHKENPLFLHHYITASLQGKSLSQRFSCSLLVLVSPLRAFRELTRPGPRTLGLVLWGLFLYFHCFQSISQ